MNYKTCCYINKYVKYCWEITRVTRVITDHGIEKRVYAYILTLDKYFATVHYATVRRLYYNDPIINGKTNMLKSMYHNDNFYMLVSINGIETLLYSREGVIWVEAVLDK